MATHHSASPLPAILRDTIVGLIRTDGADLSARQLGILLIGYLEDGPHTVRGLAERLAVAKPAVTRALDRLEQFDLARRAPDLRDRRSVLVTRTVAGAAYMAMVRRLIQASAREQGMEIRTTPSARVAV